MLTGTTQTPIRWIAADPLSRWERLTAADLSLEKGFLCLIVLSTALAQIGELSIGGFSFRGWAWVIVLAGSFFFLLPHRFRNPVRGSWWIWIPWVLWMIEKTDFSDRDAAQRFFIFLTPLLTLYACSSMRHVTAAALQKSMHRLAILSVLVYLAAALSARSLGAAADWYSLAGIAMTFTLLAVSSWAGQQTSRGLRLGCLGGYYLILVLTESRMPILAVPVLMVLGCNALRPAVKCLLGATIVLLALAAFYTEPVQQNLFHQGYGSLQDLLSFDPEVVSLSGRLNAWPQFLAAIENRWFGDGAAASAVFGYATFQGWTHPHNDYIRILFDYGYVGCILLALPVAHLLIGLIRRSRRHAANPPHRWLFATAINGLLATLILGISGNVLMYIAYIGNILFALIGCTYAIDGENP